MLLKLWLQQMYRNDFMDKPISIYHIQIWKYTTIYKFHLEHLGPYIIHHSHSKKNPLKEYG